MGHKSAVKRRSEKSRSGRWQGRAPPPGAQTPPKAAPAPSGGRQWLFRLIAFVLLPLLTLAVLEGALRLAGYGYATGFFEKIRVGG